MGREHHTNRVCEITASALVQNDRLPARRHTALPDNIW